MSEDHLEARSDLVAWAAEQPDNYFLCNRQLRRLVAHFMGPDLARFEGQMSDFGNICAGTLDRAAIVNNRPWNLPRLERWSPLGERVEEIEHHPSYHVCGKAIYEHGEVIAAYGDAHPNFRAQVLFYLSSHVGEAGHNCPVACTAGVAKVLQHAASPALKERYLERVLDRRYERRFDGAQFLTEVQGGSDVGANSVAAQPDGEEMGTTRWKINGEKWFCSNADADLILMTARWENGPRGTRGLGLFLVPRILPDGTLNGLHLRRLKDKLGTRSMPSGELDFRDALGFAIGPVSDGFQTVMRHVINTSRLYNSVGCAGLATRATLIGAGYAAHRRAFGTRIADFPMVQEMCAKNLATSAALTAGALTLAALADRADDEDTTDAERAFLRVGTNLVKMRSCQHSHQIILTAIETLGGNGAIESFSILPRLLRDNVVYENWEGTHNTLVAQSVRDFAKHGLHQGFIAHTRAIVSSLDSEVGLNKSIEVIESALGRAESAIEDLIATEKNPGIAGLRLKPNAELLADIFFATAYAQDIAREIDASRRAQECAALYLFVSHHLAPEDPRVQPDYPALVARVATLMQTKD